MSNPAIRVEHVWKIFGNTSPEALNDIQNNKISKKEALEKYNSVIGVADVSFDVEPGEIFVSWVYREVESPHWLDTLIVY